MFKYYLTYNFVLSFQRSCSALLFKEDLSSQKTELLQSVEKMVHQFTQSLQSEEKAARTRFLAVALMHLRDCKDLLDSAQIWDPEVRAQFYMIQGRFEKMLSTSHEALTIK